MQSPRPHGFGVESQQPAQADGREFSAFCLLIHPRTGDVQGSGNILDPPKAPL